MAVLHVSTGTWTPVHVIFANLDSLLRVVLQLHRHRRCWFRHSHSGQPQLPSCLFEPLPPPATMRRHTTPNLSTSSNAPFTWDIPMEPAPTTSSPVTYRTSATLLTLETAYAETRYHELNYRHLSSRYNGGIFALHAHCALLLDYVPPVEPPSTPLGNALSIR